MRISTNQIFQAGIRQLMNGQSNLYKLQNQLASEKRFQSAQEDPVAAVQVLLTAQSRAVNLQYVDNQKNAFSQLGLEEERLQSVVDSIQYIREQTVAGGNASYSDSQREIIARDLQSQFDFLLGMANSTDANGYYLFSGYQGNTRPFQQQADGSVQYAGDDGQRLLQVGTSRQMPISDSGRSIFGAIHTGNGIFAMDAASTNTGTGVLSSGSLKGPTPWNGNDYQIQFTSATNYTVTDMTTSTVIGAFPFTSGTEITEIPGVSFSIQGTPAAGDTFTLEPSTNQSIFTTLQNLITAFSTGIAGNPTLGASVRNTISAEMQNLDRALENVSMTQAAIGSRRSELNSLTSAAEALDNHYQARIQDLQGIDYAQVISEFLQQSMQLEAAQSSFARITGLSLFNYL